MDAVKFLKEKKRMCDKYSNCTGCPASEKNTKFDIGCGSLEEQFPEEFVAIVEKWSAENPIKTRKSEFLKMFPNADMLNGIIRICPDKLDQNSVTSEECSRSGCFECQKKYWLAEVE